MHGKKCTFFLIGVFLDVEFKSGEPFFSAAINFGDIGEKSKKKITLKILNNGV